MTTEAVVEARSAVGHVSRVGYASTATKRKRCRKKIKLYPPPVSMPIQELFLSCKQVFKGPGTVPLPHDVNRLCHILDNMIPEDVGLSSQLQFFKPGTVVRGNQRVTCTAIYQCHNFSLCIFFLPATAVIPLHNHPGMTVFSKLLLGKMHIKSYDLVDPPGDLVDRPGVSEPVSPSNLRLARLVTDSVFTSPCDTSVLYPTTGGNIHQFTAVTPCAVLDVLGPPYSKEDGRDCSYYKDVPYNSFSNGEIGLTKEEGDRHAWLEETEMPENSQMDPIEYLGPQVVDI